MEYNLFNTNKAGVRWEDSVNNRIVITKRYPSLSEQGIRCFGHYSNKIVQPKLSRGHHGSCYEIHYVETGLQPFYTYPSAEAGEEEAILHWIRGGDIFITSPYEYHSTGEQKQQRGSTYWIQIDSACKNLFNQKSEAVALLLSTLKRIKTHVLRVPSGTARRFTEAFQLLLNMNEENLCRACSLLSLFVFEIGECAENSKDDAETDKSSIMRTDAVDFIRGNLLTPKLDLAMVAEHMHYSRPYTATLFKREVGTTIHEYIIHCKIDLACELLAGNSITRVAAILNFSSSQHFCKVFKEQIGITPTEYVNKVNRGQIRIHRPPLDTPDAYGGGEE